MNSIISPRAEKQLRKLPKFDQIVIVQKIRELSIGDVLSEEKLSGYKDIYRIRVGDYRIVYRKTAAQLYIILIRHRRDVYRLLKEILR